MCDGSSGSDSDDVLLSGFDEDDDEDDEEFSEFDSELDEEL